jgi:small-conductance mechanosensitive channel
VPARASDGTGSGSRRLRWGLAGARTALLAALGAALLGLPAFAQIPGLPGLTGNKGENTGKGDQGSSAQARRPTAATPPDQREELEQELAQARELRDRLQTGGVAPPAGASERDVQEQRRALELTVYAYEARLRALRELEDQRRATAAAKAAVDGWSGLPDKPPYSMLVVEEYEEGADAARLKLGALRASKDLSVQELPRLQEAAQRAEEAARAATEAVAAARSPEQAAPAAWRRELARLQARSAAAAFAVVQTQAEVIAERIETATLESQLHQLQLQAARAGARFTEEDAARAREALRAGAARIDDEARATIDRADKLAREREAAQRALDALRAGGSAARPPDPSAVERAEAKLRALDAAIEANRFTKQVLDALGSVAVRSAELWKSRYAALHAGDAERRRAALDDIRRAGEGMRSWGQFALNQIALLRAEERSQQAVIERLGEGAPTLRYEQDVLVAMQSKAAVLDRLILSLDRFDRTLRRWLGEIDQEAQARPLMERAGDAWAEIAHYGRAVWQFELFAVEDTVDVEGRKITTERPVTVGKSLGALLLFVAGYWVMGRLARWIERRLVDRARMAPHLARTLRRWITALSLVVLAIVTLNLARIPLTVFAFAGGALAIGVGFGTQTLIKNLISGLIVLLERKVRVGDIVEVEGITGTVTAVDLRSCTVRGFDGVESLVPNSMLLENRVTNWTYSNWTVRRVLKIGVAYGSAPREVAGILQACAQQHPRVLKEPAPMVLFEDFGDSALAFALYVWIDLSGGVVAVEVLSDLRYAIEERMRAAGVGIPFAQHDVHLDTSRPLQVQVMGASNTGDRGADARP